ncbi:NAD(P)H-dependent oxidoreductase [Hyphomicrobium sp.]|uniref:NAD(P)H-dependent oxidoreductase n=1 Tax=Hyphomicrobium sp. TaxID=82 RepID=UPI002B6F453D|nr:NAD(P)H-dependent oxidoreductase [Hyphomicrobium sp.]HRN87971.1 NAD(P)H-dependent oxidoreductase [Hyphomicrobium sp.]HRQ26205.1 NAD(P)H-dependent oxidoreductase [Hyphomicrobium sp.]
MNLRDGAHADTCLVVTCHPSPTSFCARIASEIVREMEARGAPVLVDDLVGIGFNPAVTREEFATFYQDRIPDDLVRLVAHLRAARELVFVLPVWMYAMPAILKGYFDRVWRPHVAYRVKGEEIEALLGHITRMTVIVTHGRSMEETALVGDGSGSFFETSLPSLLPNLIDARRFDFYALDTPDSAEIERELQRVRDRFKGA